MCRDLDWPFEQKLRCLNAGPGCCVASVLLILYKLLICAVDWGKWTDSIQMITFLSFYPSTLLSQIIVLSAARLSCQSLHLAVLLQARNAAAALCWSLMSCAVWRGCPQCCHPPNLTSCFQKEERTSCIYTHRPCFSCFRSWRHRHALDSLGMTLTCPFNHEIMSVIKFRNVHTISVLSVSSPCASNCRFLYLASESKYKTNIKNYVRIYFLMLDVGAESAPAVVSMDTQKRWYGWCRCTSHTVGCEVWCEERSVSPGPLCSPRCPKTRRADNMALFWCPSTACREAPVFCYHCLLFLSGILTDIPVNVMGICLKM